MVVNKRKKVTKQRAKTTHGYGSMKKNRGAGNRGGRGLAGTGKRGDAKKPSIWKNKKYFGVHGFKTPGVKKINTLNINYLDKNAEKLVGVAVQKKGDVFIVDLSKLGYDKLLGTGKVSKKFDITAKYASAGVIEKVTKAGGKVNVLAAPAEEEPAEPEE